MTIDNFSWLIEGKLAGSAQPFLTEELVWLQQQGIEAIVSLTERPLHRDKLVLHSIDELGFSYHHIPIVDHTAPTQEQIDEFVAFVEGMLCQDSPVLAHCAGGYGRTGTMLACFLVNCGCEPQLAIETVRYLRPGSIERNGQEECIFEYARRLSVIGDRG